MCGRWRGGCRFRFRTASRLSQVYVELLLRVPYGVIEGESSELIYEFAPQAMAYPVEPWIALSE